jgi:hypothetical protein
MRCGYILELKTVNPFVPGSSPGQGAKLNNQDIFECLFLYHRSLLQRDFRKYSSYSFLLDIVKY